MHPDLHRFLGAISNLFLKRQIIREQGGQFINAADEDVAPLLLSQIPSAKLLALTENFCAELHKAAAADSTAPLLTPLVSILLKTLPSHSLLLRPVRFGKYFHVRHAVLFIST